MKILGPHPELALGEQAKRSGKVSGKEATPAHSPSLPRYFLIERGKNMCGLAACASYPIPLV